jgi:hypothetical protein
MSNFPEIRLPTVPINTNPDHASEFHHRLIQWINDFHRSLDDQFEVGARLVNFGQTITFHIENIENIGYWNPSLISFTGQTEDGEPVELIQHVSQISILLMKMKRKDMQHPKKPIGFANWDEFEKAKNSE